MRLSSRIVALSCAVALLAIASLRSHAADDPKPPEKDTAVVIPATDPRAAILVQVMNAVKKKDIEAFKTCFSKGMREKIKDNEWSEGIDDYHKHLVERFGADFDPKDVQFRYEGGEAEGKGEAFKGEVKTGYLRIIKEGDAWKVNER